MEKNSKIYIAGHRGLVGSSIKRKLEKEEYKNLIFKKHSELDLTDQKATQEYFLREKPDYVFDAAAKVGGIYANNTYKADFIYENLQIQNNIIHSSYKVGVKKLLFMGSNCIYPRDCPQPMKEEHLLSGKLEPTNEGYALAKIAGIKMCQFYNEQYGTDFISIIPPNLFGPNDNFDAMNSHFVPALIRKFHEAKKEGRKEVVLWGSGNPKRELMHVDDLADAAVFLMKNYNSSEPINIGTGEDMSIKDIAGLVKKVVGFEGEIIFDKKNPDGMPRKLLDSSKINSLGWEPKTSIEEGLEKTYKWFIEFYREN